MLINKRIWLSRYKVEVSPSSARTTYVFITVDVDTAAMDYYLTLHLLLIIGSFLKFNPRGLVQTLVVVVANSPQ